MWPGGRGLLHSVFYNMNDWNSWWRRNAHTWPAAGVRPDAQFINTDAVVGFSWNEVRSCCGICQP